MLKNYIYFALSIVVFAFSILFVSTYLEIKPLIIMFSLGVIWSVFISNAGFSKRDFDERKYKKIIRGKNKQIKGLEILNMHATQAASDFFKQLQANENLKQYSLNIDNELVKQSRAFEMSKQEQELNFNQVLMRDKKNDS